MDCFVISANSAICKQEVRELIGKDSTSFEKVCLINNVSVKDLATLAYHSQSALRVCILIGRSKDKDNITFNELDYFKGKTFGVEHIKILDDKYPSVEFATDIGGQLQDITQSVVNLKSPEIKVISCNDKEIFVGIDVVGFNMGKRPYKLLAYPGSVNGAFAYCLLRLAGVNKTTTLVDPFCGSATIPIEASLFQNRISPFKFGKKLLGVKLFHEEFAPLEKTTTNKNLISGFDHQVKVMLTAQKNAKVAGIHDLITISKVAIDWIDAKFAENAVDIIVTNPPKINKRTNNRKQIEKIYDELFYQSKYLLKKQGTLAMLLNHEDIVLNMCEKHGFKHLETQTLFSGKQEYLYCLFQTS